MTTFDPWTATMEEAQAQPDVDGPEGAVFQWSAAAELTKNRDEILAGNGYSVLKAVALCAQHGLALPDWLARVFLKRYRAVRGAGSWDAEDVFGRPYPKGAQLSALRRRRLNRVRVCNAVAAAINRDPDCKIDTAFWEEIGRVIGEGKSNAQRLHAEAVRIGFASSPTERKRRFGASPTKLAKLAGIQKRR